MNYLPILVDLKYKNVLVVGAGQVPFNKIILLLRSGDIISIFSKDISLEIKKLLDQKNILDF